MDPTQRFLFTYIAPALCLLLLALLSCHYHCYEVYICEHSNSEEHIIRKGYHFPFIGNYAVKGTNRIIRSPFHRDFHKNDIVYCDTLISCEVHSFNILYLKKMQKRIPSIGQYWDNSDVPYFVHLYNTDPEFQIYLWDLIDRKQIDKKWLIEKVCTNYRCGGPYLNLLDKRVQLLFNYKANHQNR